MIPEPDDAEEEDQPTYCIKRFYRPDLDKESEVVRGGLTLQEAKDHCEDPDTATDEYFEGFRAE